MDKTKKERVGTEDIWIYDFTEETASQFHEQVLERYEDQPNKPIVINISSYGGEVNSLMSMMDTMDSIRSMADEDFKFITVAKGKAMSAGALLLSYGDIRFAERNSQLMVHQIVSGLGGSHPENEVEFEEIDRLNKSLLTILRKQCKLNMNLKDLRALLAHNLYMTAQEAKEFGLVDFIGYPIVVETKLYQVKILNSEPPKKEQEHANRRTNKNSAKAKNKD